MGKQARRDVTHLVVLMTDGGQFGPRPPIGPVAMADTIRRSGIRTVVIGIDSHLNAEMLKMIGGGRWYGSKRKDLMSANFVKKMSKVICQAATENKEKNFYNRIKRGKW